MTRDEADRAFHALFNAIDYAMKAAAEWPDTVTERHKDLSRAANQLEELLIEAIWKDS